MGLFNLRNHISSIVFDLIIEHAIGSPNDDMACSILLILIFIALGNTVTIFVTSRSLTIIREQNSLVK